MRFLLTYTSMDAGLVVLGLAACSSSISDVDQKAKGKMTNHGSIIAIPARQYLRVTLKVPVAKWVGRLLDRMTLDQRSRRRVQCAAAGKMGWVIVRRVAS